VELLDRGARVRLAVNNFTQRDPLSRNALRDRFFERDFARLLAEQRADLVHVHHLAGHGASLVAVAARRGLPIVYQLQDWWAACARANLLDRERRLCSGPGLGKCSWCLPLTRRRPAALWNRLLYLERRRRLRGALERADRIVAGSRAVVDSHRALGWLPAGIPVDVLAYGVEVEATLAPDRERADDGALVLGFIGSLLPHKGAHVAAAALSGLDPARVRLDVWGDAAADPAYAAEVAAAAGPGRLRLRGVFPEEATARVLGSIDVLVVPSLGLESYGLVAREALAYGVPVLASRRGALAELFADGGGGALFDPARPAELRGWIERLLADPGLLARWRATRPPIARAADHAVQIERIYAEILAGRRR
jgi:glycosyltransferase involved in cell wall biosynthesis